MRLLNVAVSTGAVSMLDLFISKHGLDPNAADAQHMTPLQIAAGRGDADMVQALLARGAMPDLTTSPAGSMETRCVLQNHSMRRLLSAAPGPEIRIGDLRFGSRLNEMTRSWPTSALEWRGAWYSRLIINASGPTATLPYRRTRIGQTMLHRYGLRNRTVGVDTNRVGHD